MQLDEVQTKLLCKRDGRTGTKLIDMSGNALARMLMPEQTTMAIACLPLEVHVVPQRGRLKERQHL